MHKIPALACLATCLIATNMPICAVDPSRPKIMGIAHIAFYVSDLEKAREFWTDFLGYQ
ncbi:MAG: VOC family protein, partial [Acidobacteriaceae bacterium]|nr:VOC family protein [Acidobacteriaceae bacterium]